LLTGALNAKRDAVVGEQRAVQARQHVGCRLRVVVEDEHERHRRAAQPDVAGPGEAEVAALRQHLYAAAGERRRRGVLGVVDEQDLELVAAELGAQAVDAGARELGAAEAGDDHRAAHSCRPDRQPAARETSVGDKLARSSVGLGGRRVPSAMARTPWFERRFRFDLPPENHHDVVVRLMGAPMRLVDLCRGLDAARATARHGGTWSIQENVGHLLDVEELWAARTEELRRGVEVLRAADLQNRRTHEARHNDGDLCKLLSAFGAARAAWVELLRSLPAAEFSRSARHPRLDQPMRLVDHCVFVAEHDDHHLGRILQLLSWP
jgi:uncharacterized damage-inducible protein DinB